MNSRQRHILRPITRFVCVAAAGILAGLLLYQGLVFIPTMRASQFASSSITIALVYSAWESHSMRNGLAALLVWFVLLTCVIVQYNWWLLFLNSAYIGGLALATILHQKTVEGRNVRHPFLRVALAGAYVALANGLIVVYLMLLATKGMFHWVALWEGAHSNFQYGALIGLATGAGMELAEYVVGKYLAPPGETQLESA